MTKLKLYPERLQRHLFIALVTAVLVSNIIAAKQIVIGPFSMPAGTLCFPIVFTLSDIISEIFGYRASREVDWIGFWANLFMIAMFGLTIVLPSPVWFEGSESFASVLGAAPRIAVAGFIAYHLSGWVDDVIFSKMRRKAIEKHGASNPKGFGSRAMVSSLFGQIVDSAVFFPIAFYGVLPTEQLPLMIVTQVIVKNIVQALTLPIMCGLVNSFRKWNPEFKLVEDGETLKHSISGK